MSRFFVGQQVRIVCPASESHLHECRITALDVASLEVSGRFYIGSEVNVWDEWVGDWCVFEDHELEPILPSGHQPAELTVEELLPFLREKVTA